MDYPNAITFYPNFKNDSISETKAAIYYDNAVFKDGTFERTVFCWMYWTYWTNGMVGKPLRLKVRFFIRKMCMSRSTETEGLLYIQMSVDN